MLRAALIAAALGWAGCLSESHSGLVRVEPAVAPAAHVGAHAQPGIPDAAVRNDAAATRKFVAAREALWNDDADTAVKLLRELRAENGGGRQFDWLIVQCYEHSGRWADSLRLSTELELEHEFAGWREFVRFMAGLPPRQIEFAPTAPPVPITLHHDDLMVVEAEVNGVTARLLVDTGAGMSWLTERFAARAGVQCFEQSVAMSDANDQGRATHLALIRELHLSGLTVRNLPALAGRSVFLLASASVDGVLGWDVLQHADITWDFPARVMTLAAPEGPPNPAPNLGGRTGPLLTLVSGTGQPLHVFLDTGAHAGFACIDFYDGGVLGKPDAAAPFSAAGRPTFTMGMNSLAMSWPRIAKPYAFWLAGHRFEVPAAALYRREQRQEGLALIDGMVGNAPFLQGRLRICGVRREATFELRSPRVVALSTIPGQPQQD